MDPANTCPRCGASRLANAPAGLCPRCLLGHGLEAGNARAQDAEIEAAGGVITGQWNQPAQSGILSTIERAVGPVPRVLLRDDRTDQRPAVASSEAIPTSAGDAGRYHLHGEI